ncbi:MAG: PorV/PorQ family protein, partial [Candidatus Marinimicrobia bacterium]|nr:PorV/PorQ family protein [Candidatus Neomarinimicrobiota bacterium]MCF7923173.1 PorV/PorQ family protein [Candidatus Neomarinimicrobiota bacterium]
MYRSLILLLFLVNGLWASSSIGSVAGQFLEVNMHVRNMGMGNAATSLVGGSSAFLVNPAGLGDFRSESKIESYVSYVNWPAGISFGAVGIAYDAGNIGTFGINTVYVNYGDELRTTPDMPFGDGNFSIGGMSLGLSYSRHLTDKFSFGISLKNVNENYDESGYSQAALDIGTLYRADFHNIRIGMSILHFSKEAQFDGTFLDFSDPVKYALNDSSSYASWPLPMTFRTGVSMDALETDLYTVSVAMDMIHSNNNSELYGLGSEIRYLDKYFGRIGYQAGTDIQGLSFGGGVQIMNN